MLSSSFAIIPCLTEFLSWDQNSYLDLALAPGSYCSEMKIFWFGESRPVADVVPNLKLIMVDKSRRKCHLVDLFVPNRVDLELDVRHHIQLAYFISHHSHNQNNIIKTSAVFIDIHVILLHITKFQIFVFV